MGSIFQSSTIPALEQVVSFAQQRHELLASNVANLDTPGYAARDLSVEDFQSRLRQAIDLNRSGEPESPGMLTYGSDYKLADVSKNSHAILQHDQTQVGPEYTVNEMVKNRMQHNLALSILTQQFHLLQAAISERP